MWRSADAVAFVSLLLATAQGCSHPGLQGVRVGHHDVRLVSPAGWEHLDHGREQIFRRGEMVLVLEDLGPATREGLVRELRDARRIADQGRIEDAFSRVRDLTGAPFFLASSHQEAEFWRPWNEVAALHGGASRRDIDQAFEALIENTSFLPPVTPDGWAAYALHRTMDTRRRQIARQARRTLPSGEWVDVDTWDRVTHLDRHRLACLDHRGYLLVLAIDRGPVERAAPVFEALLTSIEVAP